MLSLLDVAARQFISEVESSTTPDEKLRNLMAKNGAGRVYLDATCFPMAIGQLHRAHISYIVARADRLCYELRWHPNVRGETRQAVQQKGDFLRRTVATLLTNQFPKPSVSFPPSNDTMLSVFPKHTLALLDYYRLCRNEELHDELGDSAESGAFTAFKALPIEQIKPKFKMVPNSPQKLAISDAVLCSKAWQDASIYLCKELVWENLATELIRKRFSSLSKNRRRNGATKFLRSECLWSEFEADSMMERLGWSA
ncbi:hypothetical protein [Rhodopirellula sp. SWK7]|uniref:hypothetical protein n=1 Tax=Rhodopirellula sp. SWK7 TaxID=595460 RepID=UPI0005C497EA|nr:hypothetical protein [Rhodopirellula sp. SWK7]